MIPVDLEMMIGKQRAHPTRGAQAGSSRHLLSRVKILLHLNDAIYPAGVPTHQPAARALETPDAA